jgi:hypothetical protein
MKVMIHEYEEVEESLVARKDRYSWKNIFPSGTLPSTNLIVTILELNLGFRCEKLATDLSYGTAVGK